MTSQKYVLLSDASVGDQSSTSGPVVDQKIGSMCFSVSIFCEIRSGAFSLPHLDTRFVEHSTTNQDSSSVIIPAKYIRFFSSRISDIFIEVRTLLALSSSVSKVDIHGLYRNEKLNMSINRA
jgi:hypothetical protein